jgi:uncharacterized protein YybS (DUF2232 family)
VIRKTSAMVEAGILAAIAIVFAIISMYVPVIGSFINFLWPLPIAICGMRNGLRWSVMTLIVADIAVAVLISPLLSLCFGRGLQAAGCFWFSGADLGRVYAPRV